MKKVLFLLLTVLMIASQTYAQTEGPSVSEVSIETLNNTPDVAVLEARLHEIKDMDRSNLSKDEKRALREEVRSIRTELINSNQGVYISFGALVIIILLLVIIF
jgi:hypothetical protein